ncbi:proline-rich protein 32 [Hippopotamus amphibius kiboko]|uniref:proline-rich protein 32 n=1 Tax=Hippopotamus amphibius kiboko TaxID=575201 RepID=UPI002595D615|nr:proline-rich protein 32 [Hippopotamus amphibius kiboko]
MACIENVLGGHAGSPTAVAADAHGNREPRRAMPLQCPSSMQKDDAESQGHPRVPLRPPFNVLTDLAREQLERPSERTGSCIPVDGLRTLKPPYGPPPAVAEESLATAEVNSSEGLVGRRLRGQDSINVSREFSGGPPALMVGGTRVSNGGTERGGSNARLYMTLPRGQGFFPSRGPQVRVPPHIPTLRSGIMMEVPPGSTRGTGKERLARVSFPLGGPQQPVETWPRPMALSSSTASLPSCTTAHCFIPPRPPSFNPFLAMPIAFAPPPIFGPPLPSYFANFPSWGMPAPASSNRENN